MTAPGIIGISALKGIVMKRNVFQWNFSIATYYTIAGFLAGLLLLVVAMLIETLTYKYAWTLGSLALIQRSNRILWLVDFLPFLLGAIFRIIGIREEQLRAASETLET